MCEGLPRIVGKQQNTLVTLKTQLNEKYFLRPLKRGNDRKQLISQSHQGTQVTMTQVHYDTGYVTPGCVWEVKM